MATPLKEDRLNVRLSPTQKRLLTRAAQARHLTTSQFVIQASLDAAAHVLAEETTLRFTPEQWQNFEQRLDQPARVIPPLKRLFEEPEPF